MKKSVAVVLLVIGAFFTFAPHETHVSFGFTSAHMIHVTTGVVLLALGVWLFVKSTPKTEAK